MSLAFIFTLAGTIKEFLIFVSYITNTTTFPEPLSPEEEDKYLKLYKSGNEDARNILVKETSD